MPRAKWGNMPSKKDIQLIKKCPTWSGYRDNGLGIMKIKDHGTQGYPMQFWVCDKHIVKIKDPIILERLSTDPTYGVRLGVACNERTPVAVLERLSTDPTYGVRLGVACNERTPVAVLEKFSKDTNKKVRLRVALDKRTPDDILEKLCHDQNKKVIWGAARTLDVRHKNRKR